MTGANGVGRTHVGRPLRRFEDGRFLRGQGQFMDDISLPRMLEVAFVRSPVAHGRIRSIDTSRATALPGVAAVITGPDLEGVVGPFVTAMNRPELKPCTRPQIAVDRVRFVGEIVAAVVASSRYIAEDARDLVEVDIEELPAVVDAERALTAHAPLIHDDIPGNLYAHIEWESGDVERAFADAARVFSKRFYAGSSDRRAARDARGGRQVGRVGRGDDRLVVDADALHHPGLRRHGARPVVRPAALDRAGRRRRLRQQVERLYRGGDRAGARPHARAPGEVDRGPLGVADREHAREGARDPPRHRFHGRRALHRLPHAHRGRRRRLSEPPQHLADRSAHGRDPDPGPLPHRRLPLRAGLGRHEQGAGARLSRRRLVARPHGARDAGRRDRPRARDRPGRAAAAEHDPLGAVHEHHRDELRRRQLPGERGEGAGAGRLPRLPRAPGAGPRAGSPSRHRGQPVRRADRLGRGGREGGRIPGRVLRLLQRDDGARRDGRGHLRDAQPRPGPRDLAGPGDRRPARRPPRGRQDRLRRHRQLRAGAARTPAGRR